MSKKVRLISGYTLIELLISMTIGVILIGGILVAYQVQTGVYKVTNSQAAIQNAENAVSALVIPVIRSAGFLGCSTAVQAPTNSLNSGAPPPLGALTGPGIIFGYDAVGTAGGGAVTLTRNAVNDGVLTHWLPNLDASLTSNVQPASDVITVLGPPPGVPPTSVTQMPASSDTFTVTNAAALGSGQIAAVSDCSKSTVFNITNIIGNAVAHGAGAGPMSNAASTFTVAYTTPQLIPLQQTAFYVALGPGGQSALMRATYSNGGTWASSPLIPGIQTLQVLYGVGSNSQISQYVAAGAVSNWTQVYAVRLAFLIEGQPGSGGPTAPTAFNLLGTTVNVLADGRLRRVYDMTVSLRNAS